MKEEKQAGMPYCLSESDLMLIDDYKPDLLETNPQLLVKILWKNGMDVKSFKFDYETNTHRNLRNQAYTGRRVLGTERMDKEWAQSGLMSLEAAIASSTDKEHRKDLIAMAKRSRLQFALSGEDKQRGGSDV